jgi:hypothetical protein
MLLGDVAPGGRHLRLWQNWEEFLAVIPQPNRAHQRSSDFSSVNRGIGTNWEDENFTMKTRIVGKMHGGFG